MREVREVKGVKGVNEVSEVIASLEVNASLEVKDDRFASNYLDNANGTSGELSNYLDGK